MVHLQHYVLAPAASDMLIICGHPEKKTSTIATPTTAISCGQVGVYARKTRQVSMLTRAVTRAHVEA